MKDMNICKKICLAGSHNRGMGLVPSKQPNELFLAQIVLSRVTRVRIFCEGAAQRINKQNVVRNHLRKSISAPIPSSEFEADLEDNLFDYNSEYEDCEYNSDYVIYSNESVFDKSSCEEMSCDEYPVRTNKKQRREEEKTCGEKEGRKLTITTTTTTTNN